MRRADRVRKCLLSGLDRTYRGRHENDAINPIRTSTALSRDRSRRTMPKPRLPPGGTRMSAIFSYEPRTRRLVGSAAGQHFSLLTQHAPSAETCREHEGDVVTHWGKEGEVRPGKWTPSDFSFEMPGHHRPALRSLHLSVLTEADRLNVAARGMHALNDCLRARQGAIVLAERATRARISSTAGHPVEARAA